MIERRSSESAEDNLAIKLPEEKNQRQPDEVLSGSRTVTVATEVATTDGGVRRPLVRVAIGKTTARIYVRAVRVRDSCMDDYGGRGLVRRLHYCRVSELHGP